MRDAVVIGGGLIGTAVAFGLQRMGLSTVLLDEGDIAYRAARGNFGLVWLQSKGGDSPAYVSWTRRSVDAWPQFAADLLALTGIDVGYRRPGGFHLCLSAKEIEKRSELVRRIYDHQPADAKTVMVDAATVKARIEGLGDAVLGASYNPLDGDCHSLALFRALHEGYRLAGGTHRSGTPAQAIRRDGAAYRVETGTEDFLAPKVVAAAGLGLNRFAESFGLPPLVRPQKGQILVTERLDHFLDTPISQIRQTPDGTVLIGDTKEEAGFDDGSTLSGIQELARRAVSALPRLAGVRLVRSWAALRVLTQDGLPLYHQPEDWPGVFLAATHSGVTLAPGHVGAFSHWVADGHKPSEFDSFSAFRFSGPQVASVPLPVG